jgi:hypothetical protein
MAEEKVDELVDELGTRRDRAADWVEDAAEELFEDDEEELEVVAASPRAEVEARLAQARSRRRGVAEPDEDSGR